MTLDPTAVELIELSKKIEVQLLFPCSEPDPHEQTDGGRLKARMALATRWMGEWLPKFNEAIASGRIARPEMQVLRGAIADTIMHNNSHLPSVPAARLKLEEMAIIPEVVGLVPLTDVQKEAFDYIKANGPVSGKEICKAVGISSESTFTKHHVPSLRKHGVKNKRGAGYYVD